MTPFSLVVKKRTIVRIDVVKKRSYVGPILLLDATAARSLARILVPAKLRIFATPMLGDRPSYEFRKSAYLSTCTIVRAMVICQRVCPVGHHVPSPACVVSSVPVSVPLAAACPAPRVLCPLSPCLCHLSPCPVGRRVPSPACVVSSVTVSPIGRVCCVCWPPRAQPRVCCVLCPRVCPVGRRVPSPACVVSSVPVSVLLAAACPAPHVLCPLSPCLSRWPPRAQPRVCCVLCPRVCPVGRRVPSPACVVSSVTVSSCWPPCAQPRVCCVLCHRVRPVGRRVPSPACVVLCPRVCPVGRRVPSVLCHLSPCPSCVPSPACVVSSVPVSVLLAAACPAPRVLCPLSPCLSCWPPRAQPRVCCVLCHRVRPVGRRVPSPACVVSSVTVLLAAACPAPRVLCPSPCPSCWPPRVPSPACHLSPCPSCWPPCAQPRVCCVLCQRVVLLAAVCPAPRVMCPLSPCLSCWPQRAQSRVCRVICHRVRPVGRRVPSPACVVSSVPVSVLLAAVVPSPACWPQRAQPRVLWPPRAQPRVCRVLCHRVCPPLSACLSCWPPRAQPRVCCVLCHRVRPVGRRVPSRHGDRGHNTCGPGHAAANRTRVCRVICHRVCPVGRRVPSPACVVSSVTRVCPVGRRVPSPACVVSSVPVSVPLAAVCPQHTRGWAHGGQQDGHGDR